MRTTSLSMVIAVSLCLLATNGWSDKGLPLRGGTRPRRTATAPESSAGITHKIDPSFTFSGVSHAANGVALRNRCSGTIPLRGIGPGSVVTGALLYWTFMNNKTVGAATNTALFDGKLVTGALAADNPDLCWGTAGTHSYRAYVAGLIEPGNLNQDHAFAVTNCVNSSGENPWLTESPPSAVYQEGAALIVFYRNRFTVYNKTFVYDKLAGTAVVAADTSSMIQLNHTNISGSGLLTLVGADGQTGNSYNDEGSRETTTLNGVLIAGPGGMFPNSDWDGLTGWPMPQLWDVHTYQVDNLKGTSSALTYFAPNDCFAPVTLILQPQPF
jgi:hypothetical protein